MSVRLIKISMIACMALLVTLVAFTNIIDYETNFHYVKHVLSMDTTFNSSALMGRAITSQLMQTFFYWLIIGGQISSALFCWIGAVRLLLHCKNGKDFIIHKTFANVGLFIAFIIYMLGFLIIGSEWFSMWQSSQWNGQRTAGLFVSIILLIFIFLNQTDFD